jgi:molybdopterin-synthase adenylyltransferase
VGNRVARQSFLGPDSEIVLTAAKVALVGLGGGGSHLAQQLAHVGVGNLVVIDPDIVDDTNLNRLAGATAADARRARHKTDVAERVIKGINPKACVIKEPRRWQERAELLRDCTAIFGCVDTFAERAQLEIAARRYLVPYIDIGMDVHKVGNDYCIAGQVILSSPGELCLRCVGFITDEILAREAARYGAAGGRPQVVWPNGVLASTAVGLFIQLVTPWHRNPVSTAYLEYDGNSHTVKECSRLTAMRGRVCHHFDRLDNVGDPFWRPNSAAPQKPSRLGLSRLLSYLRLPRPRASP